MNAIPSAGDILGTSQKPKVLSLKTTSPPLCNFLPGTPTVPWYCLLSAELQGLKERGQKPQRRQLQKLPPKGFHHFTVNDILNQSSSADLSSHQKGILVKNLSNSHQQEDESKVDRDWDHCWETSVYREGHTGRETVAVARAPATGHRWVVRVFLGSPTEMRTAEDWSAQGE